jgi:superfamily II DNA or RNA helicase
MSATAGLYIAHHRWLDAEFGPGQLHKVGHTGDLGARLTDGAYATCFPAGWRYVATFECASKEDAFLLETAVLHCCRERRVDGRELVRAPADELAELAAAAAAALALRVVARHMPPPYPAVRAAAGKQPTPPAEPTAWREKRAVVESLKLRSDDLIDDILTWDFTDLGATLAEASTKVAREMATIAEATTVADTAVVAPAVKSTASDMLIDEIDDAGAIDEALAEFDTRPPFDLAAASARRLELRDYQTEAAVAVTAELRVAGVAILQMACRCGKTAVAYSAILDALAAGGPADERPVCAAFFVPGLPLLRQTAQKIAAYGFEDPILLVGSDPRPVPLGAGRPDAVMTTDPAVIRAFLAARGRRLLISTYQSSPLVPTDAFALTVFDEAHRVCGGRAPRPFNAFVLAPRVGARLFMTATPAYEPPGRAVITMKDRETFGGVAYRYHLRRGIAAGFVNDFRLELVAAVATEADPLPGQIVSAMATVDKMLVFCRDIRHADALCEAVRAAAGSSFVCLVAHSRMAGGGAAAALRAFAAPGVRAVLFNCRLFQEGVEIPALNAVFFAAPRHSPRDIIQSVCRPLNAAPGKPQSVVFLPVTYDPALSADDVANLRRFATVVPFVDALLDEDPGLYEHLLDPAAAPYPLGAIGAGARPRLAALVAAARRAVRYGAAPSGRPVERLLRADSVPWDRAYGELRRVVEQCNRYPKTTDMYVVGEARCSLHNIYKHYVDRYKRGALEPFQMAALAALPHWDLYGLEGPYPWKECMAFLEQWLEEHGGEPPMCEINKGGYVGLDASAMERLSGALTIVNQSDGKKRANGGPGYTLPAEKQADLARICGRFRLRWKKERDADGELVEGGPKTFIQESHARFNAYYKAHKDVGGGEYIETFYRGYPGKHAVQENEVVRANRSLAPPRKKLGRRFAAKK